MRFFFFFILVASPLFAHLSHKDPYVKEAIIGCLKDDAVKDVRIHLTNNKGAVCAHIYFIDLLDIRGNILKTIVAKEFKKTGPYLSEAFFCNSLTPILCEYIYEIKEGMPHIVAFLGKFNYQEKGFLLFEKAQGERLDVFLGACFLEMFEQNVSIDTFARHLKKIASSLFVFKKYFFDREKAANHNDLTVGNIFYDIETEQVTWIDYANMCIANDCFELGCDDKTFKMSCEHVLDQYIESYEDACDQRKARSIADAILGVIDETLTQSKEALRASAIA